MTKLYKIGEVAELCNLTIRTLRYYEELGLITPSNVDI
ncbi:MAG: MerR family DNA-binding transcriptional regulator, partial [Christensenellales bacterium]